MKNECITRLIEAFVMKKGQCTISCVLAEIGPRISASQAASRARTNDRCKHNTYPRTSHQLCSAGRRIVVVTSLADLVRQGRLRRLARGVYGPPRPRLYRSGRKDAS